MKPVIPILTLLAACLPSPPVWAGEEELPKSLLIIPWQPPRSAPAIEAPWRQRHVDTRAAGKLIEAGVLQRRRLYHRRFIHAGNGPVAGRPQASREER